MIEDGKGYPTVEAAMRAGQLVWSPRGLAEFEETASRTDAGLAYVRSKHWRDTVARIRANAAVVRVPTIDNMVHYVSHGSPDGQYRSECRPAQVTGVGGWRTLSTTPAPAVDVDRPRRMVEQEWDPTRATLFVMTPTGMFTNECEHDAGGFALSEDAPVVPSFAGGTWHWPYRDQERLERVDRPCAVIGHPKGCRVVAVVGFQEMHTTERFAPAAPAEGAGA